jgi:hypothetical protein
VLIVRTAVVLAVLLWCTDALSDPPIPSPPISGQKEQQSPADSYDATSKHQTYAGDHSVVVNVYAPPQSEQNANHNTANSDEHAANEWHIAIATVWLAIFTGILTVATSTLAWFTYWLWRATTKLVVGAEEIAKKELRAYVGIDALNFEIEKLSVYETQASDNGDTTVFNNLILATMKNYGRTPAYDVQIFVNLCSLTVPDGYGSAKLPMGFAYPDVDLDKASGINRVISKQILQPGQSAISKVPIRKPKAIDEAEQRKITLYLYGAHQLR